ncbi:MAG: ferrochelatase [Omnitrophica bacterium RIFCSPLOWO2_12_FULL_50_11]|nr:MAG: ferrochelatase [Omnitrophica bacterium RIFCSPLOWO2_12_FULL_50_11]
MNFDHILFIGFGGPRKPEEVRPFLLQVTKGKKIPGQRLREVERHYEKIGSRSPYHDRVFRFVDRFREHELGLPVFVGMRNWHPFLKDTLAEIKSKRLKKGITFVLSPHRSEASYDCYVEALEEAKSKTGSTGIKYEYVPPWHDRPLFVQAHAEEIRKVLDELNPVDPHAIHILFTAHSIPMKMAERSQYAKEVRGSSAAVIGALNHPSWSIAYQSRSRNGNELWLGPHVLQVGVGLRALGVTTVLTVPIGFLCENAEILYDLDIELREEVEKIGLQYERAKTVMENEKFVDLVAQLIADLRAPITAPPVANTAS